MFPWYKLIRCFRYKFESKNIFLVTLYYNALNEMELEKEFEKALLVCI